MAQPGEKINENPEHDTKEAAANSDASSFRFNAHAPAFVPRSHAQMPISGYYYSCFQILGAGSDWFYFGDHQDPTSCWIPGSNLALPNCSKNILTHDLQLKIIKQVPSFMNHEFSCQVVLFLNLIYVGQMPLLTAWLFTLIFYFWDIFLVYIINEAT